MLAYIPLCWVQFLTSVSTESSVSGASSVISESSESSLWGGATCILKLFLCCEHHHVQKSYLRKIKTFFRFEATYYCFCSEKGCNGNLEKSGELSLLQDLRWTGQPVKFILGCAPKEKLFKNVSFQFSIMFVTISRWYLSCKHFLLR